MAKTDVTKRGAGRTIEATDVQILENAEDFESLSPALEKIYSEMGIEEGGEANVYITKMLADGREAKVWNGGASDYDLMALARKIGSGDYRVKLYVKHERGNFVIKGNQIFAVQLTAEEDAKLEAIRAGKVEARADGSIAAPAAITAETIAAAIRSAMPPAPASNLGMLKEVAEIVRTLAPQPVAPQGMAQFEMMRGFAEIARVFQDRDAEREPLERGVNATGMDVFLKLVDKFAPMFAQTLALAPGAAPNAALPAPANQQPATSAPSQPSQEEQAVNAMRQGIGFLVAQAKAGSDPAVYADVVIDTVPEADLEKFLALPDPVAHLVTFNMEVATHRKWFDELLAEVREALKPEPAEAEPPKA